MSSYCVVVGGYSITALGRQQQHVSWIWQFHHLTYNIPAMSKRVWSGLCMRGLVKARSFACSRCVKGEDRNMPALSASGICITLDFWKMTLWLAEECEESVAEANGVTSCIIEELGRQPSHASFEILSALRPVTSCLFPRQLALPSLRRSRKVHPQPLLGRI